MLPKWKNVPTGNDGSSESRNNSMKMYNKFELWHSRLGHPHGLVLAQVVNTFDKTTSFSSKVLSFCEAC